MERERESDGAGERGVMERGGASCFQGSTFFFSPLSLLSHQLEPRYEPSASSHLLFSFSSLHPSSPSHLHPGSEGERERDIILSSRPVAALRTLLPSLLPSSLPPSLAASLCVFSLQYYRKNQCEIHRDAEAGLCQTVCV